jgi:hypothetical protein
MAHHNQVRDRIKHTAIKVAAVAARHGGISIRGRAMTRAAGERRGESKNEREERIEGGVPGAVAQGVPWRHGGTDHPRQRQAAPGLATPSVDAPRQHHSSTMATPPWHHGGAQGTWSVGGGKNAEALHARRSEAKGARRAGGAAQIAAEDLNRRRAAVQMRHISPAAMAGVGRNNSAKGRRRVRRQSSRVRVRTRARGEGVSDRPLGSVGPELV